MENNIKKYYKSRRINMLMMFASIALLIVCVTLFALSLLDSEIKGIAANGIFIGMLIVFLGVIIVLRVKLEKAIRCEIDSLLEQVEWLNEQNEELNRIFEPVIESPKPQKKRSQSRKKK